MSKADISLNGTPLILYGELYTTYSEVTYTVHRTTDQMVNLEHYSRIGDVIIPTSGESPEDIATATCVMVAGVILAGDLNIFRTTKVDGRIISYIIKHKINRKISRLAQGKSVVHISATELAKINILFPSKSEQRKILEFLKLLDDKIAKQTQLISILKKYKRGLNHKLLSEIDGQNYQELGTVCSIVGGGTPDTLHPEYWEGSVEWFTPSEIGKNKYVLSSLRKISQIGLSNSPAKLLPAGTVLLTTRATLGEMSIARTECSTNQGFQSLIANKKRVLPEYLYYLQILIKPWCEKYASGNTFREISKVALSKCIIPVPDLNEQAKIVNLLSRADNLISAQEQVGDALTQAKEGLLQQLFI